MSTTNPATIHTPQPLFAVIPVRRVTVGNHPKGKEYPPRLDLAPMNHQAACNFMEACRTTFTEYKLTPWPADAPYPASPLIATEYRRTLFPADA